MRSNFDSNSGSKIEIAENRGESPAVYGGMNPTNSNNQYTIGRLRPEHLVSIEYN
jgi:hypothetical protein